MDPIVLLRDNAGLIASIVVFCSLALYLLISANKLDTRETRVESLEVKLERLGTQLEIERRTASDAVNRAKEAVDRNYEIKLRCQALERDIQKLRNQPQQEEQERMQKHVRELIWRDPVAAIDIYGKNNRVFDALYREALIKLSERHERCLSRQMQYQNPRWSRKAEKTHTKLQQLVRAADYMLRGDLLIATGVTPRF